jgi:hypothetical protein
VLHDPPASDHEASNGKEVDRQETECRF